MRHVYSVALLGLLAAPTRTAHAQCADGSATPCSLGRPAPTLYGTTAAILAYAIDQYGQRQLRPTIASLRNVVSRTFPNPVSSDQKVTAYKYLGAAYADLSFTDTAKVFFMAALAFDPFTDLEEGKFSDAARAAFGTAGGIALKLGIRPVPCQSTLIPDSAATAIPFRIVTTAPAQLTVELVDSSDPTKRFVLFDSTSNGQREIRWLGQFGGGRLADAAKYQVSAVARFSAGYTRTAATSLTVEYPGAVQLPRKAEVRVKGSCL